MTVIEISNSPENSKKAEAEKTTIMTTSSSDGADFLPPQNTPPRIMNKRVSFQVNSILLNNFHNRQIFQPPPITGPPSLQELEICRRVAEIMPMPDDLILKTLRVG